MISMVNYSPLEGSELDADLHRNIALPDLIRMQCIATYLTHEQQAVVGPILSAGQAPARARPDERFI